MTHYFFQKIVGRLSAEQKQRLISSLKARHPGFYRVLPALYDYGVKRSGEAQATNSSEAAQKNSDRVELRSSSALPSRVDRASGNESAERSELRITFMPDVEEVLAQADAKKLTSGTLEAIVRAAAARNQQEFDGEFDANIKAVVAALQALSFERLQALVNGSASLSPSGAELRRMEENKDLAEFLIQNGLSDYLEENNGPLTRADMNRVAAAVLEVMVFGASSESSGAVSAVPLDEQLIAAERAKVQADTKEFQRQHSTLKMSLITDNPDAENREMEIRNIRKLALKFLYVLVPERISFSRNDWQGMLAIPKFYRGESADAVIHQIIQLHRRVGEEGAVVALFSGDKIASAIAGALTVKMGLNRIDPAAREYIWEVSSYLALRFSAAPLARQEEILTSPEELTKFLNESPHTAGLMSLDENGALSINIVFLTARFAAIQSFKRAA